MQLRKVLTGLLAFTVLGAVVAIAAPGASAAPAITIWADPAHAAAISQLLPSGYKGTAVHVVAKEMPAILDELKTVDASAAPDLVWGEQSWSGDLAAANLIVGVPLPTKVQAQFKANMLSGFKYAFDRYGVPVQFSNLAMITNVSLVPSQPTTFSALASTALSLKKSGKAKVAFGAAQGGDSNGATMYPLFSGLGGYFFGQNGAGSLDPFDLGLANRKFIKNSKQVDQWNSTGLIDASLTEAKARKAFAAGKSPFWLAGPGDLATLKALTFTYRITPVPAMVASLKAVPLLSIQGFMVTKFAEPHGVRDAALQLAARYFTRPAAQLALANAGGTNPANTAAQAKVPDRRIQYIGLAGVDGVPIPNISQMNAVWGPYGTAWVKSTSGPKATPAATAFTAADAEVKAAIG